MKKLAKTLLPAIGSFILATSPPARALADTKDTPAPLRGPLPAEPGAQSTGEKAAQPPLQGKVMATTNSAGYTYMLVQHEDRQAWAAVTQVAVAIGDQVNIPQGWVMKDFKSTTLNRTFDWILFASGVEFAGKSGPAVAELPAGHPPLSGNHGAGQPRSQPPPEVKSGSIKKAPGGLTVKECHTRKNSLNGSAVKIRGVVVKFNTGILGRNWIHLRDGTGGAGADDLLITTTAIVKVGETILVQGKLGCDRDFGSGYRYAVLVEDAAITK